MHLKFVIPKDIMINMISNYIEIRAIDNQDIRKQIKEINNGTVRGFDFGFVEQGLEVDIKYTNIDIVN